MREDDLDVAQRRIGEWQDSLERRAARAQRLVSQLEGLRVTTTIADGSVSATVDHSGHLVGLRLADEVRSWSADQIASTILRASAAARAELARQAAEITRDDDGLAD